MFADAGDHVVAVAGAWRSATTVPRASTAITQVVRFGAGCSAGQRPHRRRRPAAGGTGGPARVARRRHGIQNGRRGPSTGCRGSQAGCRPGCRRRVRARERHPGEPVRAGLGDHDERLVGGERDAIGEVQAVQDGSTARGSRRNSRPCPVLHQVGPPVSQAVADESLNQIVPSRPIAALSQSREPSARTRSRRCPATIRRTPRYASQTTRPPSASTSTPSGRPPVSATTVGGPPRGERRMRPSPRPV